MIEVGERQELFPASGEEAFVAALVRAYRPRRARIAFLQGHGEAVPTSDGPQGLGLAVQGLRRRGYALAALDLHRDGVGLDTTDVVVVSAPQVDLTEGEYASLGRFLDRGGNLLVLLQHFLGFLNPIESLHRRRIRKAATAGDHRGTWRHGARKASA